MESFGFIYNFCKNKLTNEYVFKLISVYSNLYLISNRNRQNNNIQNIENDEDNIEISEEDEEDSQELSSNDNYTDIDLSE